MKTQLALVGIIMSMLPATVASAHPGHGHGASDYSLLHYLTEPMHLAVGLGTLAVSCLVIMLVRSVRPWRKTLA